MVKSKIRKRSQRPSYAELYNGIFRLSTSHLTAELRRRIGGVTSNPNACNSAALAHITTVASTQSIGFKIDRGVLDMVTLAMQLLEERKDAAARMIQRTYLRRLYRPPTSFDDEETSFVLRRLAHDPRCGCMLVAN